MLVRQPYMFVIAIFMSVAGHLALASIKFSESEIMLGAEYQPAKQQVLAVTIVTQLPQLRKDALVSKNHPNIKPVSKGAINEPSERATTSDFVDMAKASTRTKQSNDTQAKNEEPEQKKIEPVEQASHDEQQHVITPEQPDNSHYEPIVIREPNFRSRPQPPKYPKLALRRKQTGTVWVRALIDIDGKTKDVTVFESSGFEMLDNAALKAVSRWEFERASVNGMPTTAWVDVPVEFVLR